MNKPYVKICGLTNLEDVEKCVNLGASFLGFIFAQSPRRISIETAKEIIPALPKTIKTIAVFKNNSLLYVSNILERIKFDLVQLQGNESFGYISKINRPIIKVFNLIEEEVEIQIRKYKGVIPLLEFPKDKNKEEYISRAKKIAARQLIMIAGGIKEENARSIIEEVKPWCIDICSGVEKEIGKKDHQKLENLFKIIEEIK